MCLGLALLHGVHRALVNRHGLTGSDIRMAGDREAQHLALDRARD